LSVVQADSLYGESSDFGGMLEQLHLTADPYPLPPARIL